MIKQMTTSNSDLNKIIKLYKMESDQIYVIKLNEFKQNVLYTAALYDLIFYQIKRDITYPFK